LTAEDPRGTIIQDRVSDESSDLEKAAATAFLRRRCGGPFLRISGREQLFRKLEETGSGEERFGVRLDEFIF
jgi:hypothetical protein